MGRRCGGSLGYSHHAKTPTDQTPYRLAGFGVSGEGTILHGLPDFELFRFFVRL